MLTPVLPYAQAIELLWHIRSSSHRLSVAATQPPRNADQQDQHQVPSPKVSLVDEQVKGHNGRTLSSLGATSNRNHGLRTKSIVCWEDKERTSQAWRVHATDSSRLLEFGGAHLYRNSNNWRCPRTPISNAGYRQWSLSVFSERDNQADEAGG